MHGREGITGHIFAGPCLGACLSQRICHVSGLGFADREVVELTITKRAMLTHANFCVVLNIFNHWDQHIGSQEPERALAVLPLFHIIGLTFIMLLAVANGAEMSLNPLREIEPLQYFVGV
jgi:hypothetical protein